METESVQFAKPTTTCSLNFGVLGLLLVWLHKCLSFCRVAHLQLTCCHLNEVPHFWLSSVLDFITAVCICLLSTNYFTIGC